MSDLGNKEIFAKNLNYYMTINHKTRTDVCRDLDIPYSTYTDWCNGNIYPRIDKIELLANYFDIKKSDLVENKEKIDKLGNKVIDIPLLGTVKAGYDYLAQKNWLGTVEVDSKLAEGNDLFALNVKGDSMSPFLLEGDIVIVKRQSDFENGDLVVALINGDEATVKKGKKSETSILLQPLNSAYEPLIFTYEEMKNIHVIILGIVKQMKRDF